MRHRIFSVRRRRSAHEQMTKPGPMDAVASQPRASTTGTGSDVGSQMRLAMPVVAEQGGKLGTLVAWHTDPLTRRMTGFTVQHGLLRRKHTRVSMADMAHVSSGKLVLTHSKAAFMLLPSRDAA